MKAIIHFLFIASITIFLTACGGGLSNDKSGTNTGNKSEYSNYKDALAAEDFEAVHKILSQAEIEEAKIHSSDDKDAFSDKFGFYFRDIDKVKLDVLKQELTFLVSQNNGELNDRIIFLINENDELLKDKHDEYCNHVATLAANRKNLELIKMIAQQFKDPSIMLSNSAVSKFCKDEDFFVNMRYDYLKHGFILSRPQLGMVKSNHYGELDDEYDEYIKAVSTYNKLCFNALEDAKDAGDMGLAKKIVRLVKKNIKYEELGDWCKVVEKETEYNSVYNAFKVTEDDSDIKEAKELLK